MKCYRVWFKDGSAVLVNAMSIWNAKLRAAEQTHTTVFAISRVEQLEGAKV